MSFIGSAIPKQCMAKVARQAGRVTGSRIYSQCERDSVFVAPDGKCYCATHGKDYGYKATAGKAKQDFVIFYVDSEGRRSRDFVMGAASERSARSTFARREKGIEIEGVLPYESDAAVKAHPDFARFADYWSMTDYQTGK